MAVMIATVTPFVKLVNRSQVRMGVLVTQSFTLKIAKKDCRGEAMALVYAYQAKISRRADEKGVVSSWSRGALQGNE
jgi:hypothetical protein